MRSSGGSPASRCTGSSAFASSTACGSTLSPETLEPRPDTETLVDAMLPFAARDCVQRRGRLPHPRPRHRHRRDRAGAACAGPGGGRDRGRYFRRRAGDRRRAMPRMRARRPVHGASIRLVFENISGRFHVIVSNPPYIRSRRASTACKPKSGLQIRAERWMAARTGSMPTGSSQRARQRISKHDGRVAVEIGHTPAARRQGDCSPKPAISWSRAHRDLAGNDRVLVFALLTRHFSA